MKKPYTSHINFRLSKDDKTKLLNKCNLLDISPSAFLRDTVMFILDNQNSEKIFTRDTSFKRELLYEINRYGNNLNQVAYNLNRLFKADITSLQAQAIDESLLRLSKIEEELSTMRKTVSERL